MCFLYREGWRAVCWPITAARGNTLSRSATGTVLRGSGRSWDQPMAGRCHGPYAKVMFWMVMHYTSHVHKPTVCFHPSLPSCILLFVRPSPSRSQTCCVRLSSSWITVTSGPGTSGSGLGWRRTSPAKKGSPSTGQPRGTAPSLGTGQEPVLSVTTMVMTNGITMKKHKSCVSWNYVKYMYISSPSYIRAIENYWANMRPSATFIRCITASGRVSMHWLS